MEAEAAGSEQSPTAGGAAPTAVVTPMSPPSEEPTTQTPMQAGAPAVGTAAEAIALEAPAPAPTPAYTYTYTYTAAEWPPCDGSAAPAVSLWILAPSRLYFWDLR